MITHEQEEMALKIQPNGKIFFSGSRVIAGVKDTDLDVITEYSPELDARLLAMGFLPSREQPELCYPNSSVMQTYRKDEWNVVAVKGPRDYERWSTATELAVYMQLEHKHQRVALFQFITEGSVRDTSVVDRHVGGKL